MARLRHAHLGGWLIAALGAAWVWHTRLPEPKAAPALHPDPPAALAPPAAESEPLTAPAPSAPRAALARSDEEHLRELERLRHGDPAAALALALAEDSQREQHGVLAEARRALIVTLLVDNGRMAEARERARDYLRLYPGSRYLQLVQGVTGLHPRPSPREMAAMR